MTTLGEQKTKIRQEDIRPEDVSHWQKIIATSTNRLSAMAPDQNTEHNLLENFNSYCMGTLQYAQQLEGETPEQYRQRIGWAIQAAAIEVASKDGFKKNPARSEWKNALTQEILKALDSNPNHRLPGVTAYYRIPYQGHTDQYSHNRVTVRFIGLRGVESDWFLHVGTDYSALFNSAGDIATLRLLKNCKGMDESTTFWLADLFNELTLLNGIYKETPSPNIERLISKRFRLIKGILEDHPNASDNLDIIYQRENFHDRFKISVQNGAHSSLASIIIDPDEVGSKMWNLFREACIKRYPDAIVPSIYDANSKRRRTQQKDKRSRRWS